MHGDLINFAVTELHGSTNSTEVSTESPTWSTIPAQRRPVVYQVTANTCNEPQSTPEAFKSSLHSDVIIQTTLQRTTEETELRLKVAD